jgi:uncharacterized protein YnzC (UPF0291/DUF896 family)
MNKQLIQQIPNLKNLPRIMPKENAVRLELEQDVVIFRASKEVQERIEDLLEKNKTDSLTAKEKKELEAYGEIDDYLSHVNRLIRNSFETSEVSLAV